MNARHALPWPALFCAAFVVSCSSGNSSPSTPAPPLCNLAYNLALIQPHPNSNGTPITNLVTVIAANNVLPSSFGLRLSAGGKLVGSGPSVLIGPVPSPTPPIPPTFQNPIFYAATGYPRLMPKMTYTLNVSGSNCTTSPITGASFTTGTKAASPTPSPVSP